MLSGLVKLGVRGWSLLLTGEVGDRNVSGYWGPERILCVGRNMQFQGRHQSRNLHQEARLTATWRHTHPFRWPLGTMRFRGEASSLNMAGPHIYIHTHTTLTPKSLPTRHTLRFS